MSEQSQQDKAGVRLAGSQGWVMLPKSGQRTTDMWSAIARLRYPKRPCVSNSCTACCVAMGGADNPSLLCFDLDDTIVSFSTGQADLWARTLHQHAALLQALHSIHVAPADKRCIPHVAEPLDIEVLARVIDEIVTPVYWRDPVRAAQGRLDLFRSRREVLYWAMCCHFEGADVTELERRWASGQVDMNGAPFGEHLFDIADGYTRNKEDAVAPLEGAVEVLQALREAGFRLALLTNGSSEFQRRKLRRYALEPLFEVVVIEGEWGVGKPHRSVFERVLEATACAPSQVWMVGDNYEADIAGAAELGIDGVWLHHGRAVPANRPLPLHTIAHIRDLLPILLPKSGDNECG